MLITPGDAAGMNPRRPGPAKPLGEVVEIDLDGLLAGVADRTVAGWHLGYQPGEGALGKRGVIVKVRQGKSPGLSAEPGQPFLDVRRIADLADLAVADDVNADRGLASGDLGD